LKSILLVITFIGVTTSAYSQDTSKSTYTRNIVWTTPVKRNTDINGFAIGIMAVPWMSADSLRINGINFEISPFGFLGGLYAIAGTLYSPFHEKYDSTSDGAADLFSKQVFTEKEKFVATRIKGISVSLGGLSRETAISGISINGVICVANQMNGIELSGLMNLHYEFKGVMIAGLRNKVTTGKGIQIALINSCKSGRVIQLGLINRIGKRVTPIVNFSL